MAGGYTVGIASETKAFKQGIDSGVIDPLEDAQKELLALGKSRGPEQLERAMKDAERATERLGDETKDTARAIERDFRDAYRDVKRSSDDGMDGAKEGLDDFKQESQQTARESAASFDGSAESIVEAFQEVAANAFGGFGAAGQVAGIAAALGIGAAVAGFEQVGEAEQASRERAGEWAQAYVEAGSRVLSAAITTAKAQDIATDPEKYKTATENAKNWGVDVSVAIAAMSGETWALQAANDALTESENKVAESYNKATGQYAGFGESLSTANVQAERGRDALNQLQEEMGIGAQQADALSRSLDEMARNTEGAITKVDEFGDRVTTLPDGTTIYVDAETGQATTDLSLIEKKVYAMPSDKQLTVRMRAQLSAAQRDIDGFMIRNGGREIRIKTRVITSGTGWDR